MLINSKVKTTMVFLADMVLLTISVYLPGFLKEGIIPFNFYFGLFFIAWAFISFIFGKYRFNHVNLLHEITAILLNSIIVWGLLSLFVISFKMYEKSYHLLFRQILLVTCAELVFRITYYLINRQQYKKSKSSYFHHIHLRNNHWGLMFLNLLWVFLSFMFLVWLKPATLRIYIPNYYPFLIGLLLWELILNLVTGKHLLGDKECLRDFLIPILRADTLTLLLLSILVYLFHLFNYSRLIIFGTIILSATLESFFVIYIRIHEKFTKNIDESEAIIGVTPADEKLPRNDDFTLHDLPDLPVNERNAADIITENFSDKHPEIFDFINANININGIEYDKCSIFNTATPFNIKTLPTESRQLLINLHKVNDIKRINEYFSLLNDKTQFGGFIIGCGITIRGVYNKYRKRFPGPIGHILYFFHFIFRRVLPKLPLIREINYFLTKGENRTLSKTEILGRLVYSGFKIVDCQEINGLTYYIAGKVNIPYGEKGQNPSYGPFISLNRVGKHGKIINIYKFRTMHPYAEYLQDYVYNQNHLAKGGKLKDDFRIAGWGKVLRKTWIDELPQLLNFLRGDIKLVGVRALSQHYFSLYPEEFREYRNKVKPGILPPFYVDLPETMDEIIASEKKYIDSYFKYHILTDIKYGTIILFNIIFRGKRSS